jgi:hypothetical protein
MAKQRPINAEVPAAESSGVSAPASEEGRATASPAAKTVASPNPAAPSAPARAAVPKKRSRHIPLALKLIAAAVLIAIAFVVAAVLAGTEPDRQASPLVTPADDNGKAAKAAPAAVELGFPAVATKNTTRVGGSDPASNAAAIALATFPAAAKSRQPDAVTLVDKDDWRAAIAASVLMASPLGAPVLVSDSTEIPAPTLQALDALGPQGSRASQGAQAFAIGDATAPRGLKVTRVGGDDSPAIAAAIAKLRDRLFGEAPKHIVIASADQAGFAMPAAAWAARSGDPILFTPHDRLPATTAAALKQHTGIPVYVLGPASAISAAVVREIAAIDKRVRRVAGPDPVASSIALARYSDQGFGWNINDPGHGFVVARDNAPLDAAAAAPLSASGTWGPLLLSDDAAALPPLLRDYLLDLKPGYTTDPTRGFYNHVWVIGDQEAIDVNEQGEIDELAELAKIGEG